MSSGCCGGNNNSSYTVCCYGSAKGCKSFAYTTDNMSSGGCGCCGGNSNNNSYTVCCYGSPKGYKTPMCCPPVQYCPPVQSCCMPMSMPMPMACYTIVYPQGLGHFWDRMHYLKGGSDQDVCHDGAVCGEKGWTWHGSPSCCHESPVSTTTPCHDPGSLSRDIEGSCQSKPQGCQPMEPCPPQTCYPPQQSSSCGKPRRRVEVSHVEPVCPPPVKIHRRPLQQYRPPQCSEDPGCCRKPRRRVDQCPAQETHPPVILHPLPLQHRHPCAPCCHPLVQHCCPRPIQRCRPAAVPLPLHPGQHQQKQIPLLPPCLQMK
ncbi:PREDICTED: keratin-associated protein 16-1-like [Mesitornis unicolor]|uniref:keratin-associated protein 16-1-like n=1 Tax=Mesitornis unicolor TaxID=54374 RepID=UPI000528BC11|nr:PREDICTED: keratin-associated protein 16-1-like [Mesitornis unicolor]